METRVPGIVPRQNPAYRPPGFFLIEPAGSGMGVDESWWSWIMLGMSFLVSDESQKRFLLAVFAELAIGGVAIGLGWWLGPDARAFLPRLGDTAGLLRGSGLGAGLGIVLAVAMLAIARIPWESWQRLQDSLHERFLELLAPMTYLELLLLAAAAGIGEELMFRGWIQTALTGPVGSEMDWGRGAIGWIVASLLFGLAHPLSRAYILLASGMGLILGGIFLWTGNLLVPIVAHAVYDAIVLVYWKRESDRLVPATGEDG